MGCSTQRSTYRLGAAFVSWGKKNKACYSVDSSAIAGGEYFEVSNEDTDYYVWYDVDNLSVDPAVAGKTGIEVDLVSGFSYTDLIAATKLAVEAVAGADGFFVDSSDNDTCMCVSRRKVGAPLSAFTAGDTGWTFDETVTGVGGDLGGTEGGIEISWEQSAQDIFKDQTGEIPVDKIVTGQKISVSMSLSEMTPERWALIIGESTGSNYTPSGGTQVTGGGSGKLYQSLFDLSGELNLNPVANGPSDRSEDLSVWKAIPLPESWNFSGSETSKMSITFEGLLDTSLASQIDTWAYGDPEQDFRA